MAPSTWYGKFSRVAAGQTGKSATFALAFSIVLVWLLTGPIFEFSDTWQLVINTGTTIVTFLMGFLIQNTQNRDTEAIQIKLDELLSLISGTRSDLASLEEMSYEQLREIKKNYKSLKRVTKKSASLGRPIREEMEGFE